MIITQQDRAVTNTASQIEHVVVLMMENAAFDRMLGCMTDVHPALEGILPPLQALARRRRQGRPPRIHFY